MKCDGESGILSYSKIKDETHSDDNDFIYNAILESDNCGAGVIINTEGGNIHFNNLDIQSSSFIGLKLIQAEYCKISASINNCAQYITNNVPRSSYIKYSPGLYLKIVRNSDVNLRIYKGTSQYQAVRVYSNIDTQSIYGNKINLFSSLLTVGDRYYDVVDELNKIQKGNKVNVSYVNSFIEDNTSKFRLRPVSNFFKDNHFSTNGVRETGTIFSQGERVIRMDTKSNVNNEILYVPDMTFRKGHVYLVLGIQKLVADSFYNYPRGEKDSGYFGMHGNDKSGTMKAAYTIYQYITKNNNIDLSKPFLNASCFQFTGDEFNDIIEGRITMYTTNGGITIYTTNINIYDLTQDLGIISIPVQLDEFLKYIFSYSNLDSANSLFDYIDVIFPKNITPIQYSDVENAISNNINGERLMSLEGKTYYYHNGMFVDSDGVDINIKKLGSTEDRPDIDSISDNEIHKYYDTNIGFTLDYIKGNSDWCFPIERAFIVFAVDKIISIAKPSDFKKLNAEALGVAIKFEDDYLVIPINFGQLMPFGSASFDGGTINTDYEQIYSSDGESNTNLLKTHKECNTSDYAVGYCSSFSVINSLGFGFAAGKWYLPSVKELRYIRTYYSDINYALSFVDGSSKLSKSVSYWSSNEASNTSAFCSNIGGGTLSREFTDNKTSNKYVLPITKLVGSESKRGTKRPVFKYEGQTFYDSSIKKMILWNGSAWVNLDGTALE